MSATAIASKRTLKQAFMYFQASVMGLISNVVSRFIFGAWVGFDMSVILATYVGMIVVFWFSYKRAFGVASPTLKMVGKYVAISHAGMLVVWAFSSGTYLLANMLFPDLFDARLALSFFERFAGLSLSPGYASYIPRVMESLCHGVGIVVGFVFHFFGHKLFSFAAA